MSISARAAHVLSVMLIVTFASTAAGWTSVQRSAGHCTRHSQTCTPVASLTCCCPTAPAPVDPARTPRVAPPLAHVLRAPLMDCVSPAIGLLPRLVALWAPHGIRTIDLGLLHRTLLI